MKGVLKGAAGLEHQAHLEREVLQQRQNVGRKRQTEIHGSHLVVHSVAFPACVKYTSRQGVICSLESCFVQALC